MTLPYDIARCPGRIASVRITSIASVRITSIASVRITSNAGHSECVRCRRREPGHPDHQTHMEPPVFVDGKCPMRIEP